MQRVVEDVVPTAVEDHRPYARVSFVRAQRSLDRAHRVVLAVQGEDRDAHLVESEAGQLRGRLQGSPPEVGILGEAALMGGAGRAGLDLGLPTPARPGRGGQPGQDQRVDARAVLGGQMRGVTGPGVGADQHLRAGQRLVGEQLGRVVEHGRIGGRVAEGTHPVGVEGEPTAEPLVHTAVLTPPREHDQRAARGETFGFVPGEG